MLKSLLLLFYSFAKVGILGYGGGPSMIPLVQAEVVEVYKWMDMGEFADVLAMGYALPGPIATKMAAVVGYRVSGFLGALAAVLGMILPSALMVLALVLFFTTFKDNPRVVGIIKGIRPVVIALLVMVVFDMYPKALTTGVSWVIAIVTLGVFMFTSIHPAIAIVAAGVLGYLFF